MDSPNDGKELIPEFFYLPEFLTNLNQFDLGKLQANDQILDDVQLPTWAHNSPEEFIHLHRLALESDYVSAHLHQWIDLIFGCKQSGQAAIDALNVFMSCSYEKAVEADAIDDSVTREAIDGMIQNFGQIPSQLLTEPHPQRHTKEQVALQIEAQGRTLNLFQHTADLRTVVLHITPDKDQASSPIIFISIPKSHAPSFMQHATTDTLISLQANGTVGSHGTFSFSFVFLKELKSPIGWQLHDRPSTDTFKFERDSPLKMERYMFL